MLFKNLGQGFDDSIAAAYDAESAAVVEIEDKGMCRKRRFSPLGSIERKVAHQHLAQQGVGDGLVDDIAQALIQQLVVDKTALVDNMLQIAEGRQRSHLFYEVTIALKVFSLVRKTLCKLLDESIATIGKGKTLALQRHHIIRLGVQAVQHDLILDVKIVEIMGKHLAVIKATDKVHPCLKLDAIACETLQTAAHLRRLLQYGDIIAVFGEYDTRRQTS